MGPDQEPNWQPISALATITSLIDRQVASGRDQHQRLLRAAERPSLLDDATVARVRRAVGDTAADLWLYDTQLTRWARQPLTQAQRRDIERLQAQMISLHDIVEQILALAARLQDRTIETLLAKSDLEGGREWLGRNHPG
jgi:hypothetical protein